MPNDAKLGLVVGLVIVVMIAMTYYRKEPAAVAAPSQPEAPVQAAPKDAAPKDAAPPAKPPSQEKENQTPLPPPPQPMPDENAPPALPPPSPSSVRRVN